MHPYFKKMVEINNAKCDFKRTIERIANECDIAHVPHDCVSDNAVQRAIYLGSCKTLEDLINNS